MLSASQIRAARGIINWSQQDLAKASGLSLAAIRKIELGYISPRHATMNAIHGALQSSGLEFIERDGVRRCPDNISVFEGSNGGHDFFDDLCRASKRSGGDVLIAAPSAAIFAKHCGLKDALHLGSLGNSCDNISIKFLVVQTSGEFKVSPNIEMRLMPKDRIDAISFCIYGNKVGITVPGDTAVSKILVVEARKINQFAKKQFLSLWEGAKPVT